MKKLFTYLLMFTIAGLASCKKDIASKEDITPVIPVDKVAPDGFNYKTSKDITVDVTLRTNNDQPLSGVKVNIYDPANTANGKAIYTGITNSAGKLNATVNVAAGLQQVVIDPLSAGLLRYATASINGGSTNVVIGGKAGFSGDIIAVTFSANKLKVTSLTTFADNKIKFSYPSPYKSTEDAIVNNGTYPFNLGRPVYLEAKGDDIPAGLLQNINASLPESTPLTQTHPEYLESKVTSTLNIVEESDVWITYVSEGAGFLNTLAYYTYETGHAPKSVKDIKDATFVLPNSSNYGSAGGLNSGDKVSLGRFKKGTSIAFILIANAWNGKEVDENATKYFSDDALNPEKESALKKHSVVLYDNTHKLFLVGFEDLPRDGDSDNDFNDLVFYATSNPVTGISNEGVPPVDTGGDEDGDGVPDDQDEFPKDPEKASTSYFPSKDTYAQVAFEDNWPSKGDYDLNDLVIDYRYTFIKNAKNQVVSFTGDFVPKAAGASFKNGFGVELPVAASAVKSVTGQKALGTYIKYAANGVEASQKKAVIIPFDNHDAVLKYPDGSFFVNTKMDKNKITGTTVTVAVTFTSPVDEGDLKPSTFNPFLISNLRRGYEIHLPGFTPTDLADAKLFKTADDTSNPGAGRYYLTKENGPWAIGYNTSILYPIEEANINKAYLHFAEWALSGGSSYADWYSNTASGYRDNKFLYTK